jgi:hypothetical protein
MEAPMNNLYHWHDDVMVGLEMENIRNELKETSLLHDAGLSYSDIFKQWTTAVGNMFVKLGQRMQRKNVNPNQTYEIKVR